MLIAQLSDIHIVEKGRKTLGIAPMASNLSRCIDHINRLIPRPDVVLVTGDITDQGTISQAENAAELLDQLEMPYFIIPGNHDDASNLWSIFGGRACPSMTDGFINYVLEDFAVRLIAMDSTRHNAPGGELCQARLDWLSQHLIEAPHRPTIIYMHHPPVKCGVLESDEDGFIGAKRLAEIIENYSNIERIICGHIHLPVHARWYGTIVSTAPSPGMQLGLDLTMKKQSEFVLAAPAYQLHHWTDQANLITHTIGVDETEGPYPFAQV